jgi:hypothetical protein
MSDRAIEMDQARARFVMLLNAMNTGGRIVLVDSSTPQRVEYLLCMMIQEEGRQQTIPLAKMLTSFIADEDLYENGLDG